MKIDEPDLTNTMALIFEFSEEEDDAIHGFTPMTQELFNACIKKCEKLGVRVDRTYQKLITHYPEFWKNYKS